MTGCALRQVFVEHSCLYRHAFLFTSCKFDLSMLTEQLDPAPHPREGNIELELAMFLIPRENFPITTSPSRSQQCGPSTMGKFKMDTFILKGVVGFAPATFLCANESRSIAAPLE